MNKSVFTLGSKRMTWMLLFLVLFLSACADAVSLDACMPGKVYGFWSGLLHGFICPFAFIVSLFKDGIAIYAINNSGNLYNLGFVLGAAIIFGGGGNASKKSK